MVHSPVSFPFVGSGPEGLPDHLPPGCYTGPTLVATKMANTGLSRCWEAGWVGERPRT